MNSGEKIVVNVTHFSTLVNLPDWELVQKLKSALAVEMVDPNPEDEVLVEAKEKFLVLTPKAEGGYLGVWHAAEQLAGLTDSLSMAAFDSHRLVLEEGYLKAVPFDFSEEGKLELEVFATEADLASLQLALLNNGYRYLAAPGSLMDLSVSQYLYFKLHPKHGRILTVAGSSARAEEAFANSALPQYEFVSGTFRKL